MKKKLLLLTLLPLFASAQFPDQDFENFILVPNNWGFIDDAGFNERWMPTEVGNPAQPPYEGNQAIYLAPGTMPEGMVTDDWLMTPRFTAGADTQLQFYSRLLYDGDQGSIYGVYISTNNVQLYPAGYTLVEQWSESELNPVQNDYTLVTVPIPNIYEGQQIYIAFRMNTNGGDGWLIDNASITNILGLKNSPMQAVSLYPNPVDDLLHISLQQEDMLQSVVIYDINGRLCLNSGESVTINTGNLLAGMYIVKVTTGEGTFVSKLVKQ